MPLTGNQWPAHEVALIRAFACVGVCTTARAERMAGDLRGRRRTGRPRYSPEAGFTPRRRRSDRTGFRTSRSPGVALSGARLGTVCVRRSGMGFRSQSGLAGGSKATSRGCEHRSDRTPGRGAIEGLWLARSRLPR